MGDSLTSSSPLSNSDQKSNMPMLYYGLVVVATAAIVLAVYNLIVIKRCGRRHMPPPSQPTNIGVVEERRSLSRNLLSSFKYKKEAEEEEEGEGGLGISRRSGRDCEEDSCAVCLSGFEEGEEVRKLPRCNHCFHVMCIDMWLYSHFDCPICRTPVVAAAFSRSSGDENAVAVAVSV